MKYQTMLEETLEEYLSGKLSQEAATRIFKAWDLKNWEIKEINKHFEYSH